MKEKWQSIRGFFRKNSRKLIPLLLLAAILLPIVVDNSYVLGICTKILLYMLLASSVNVINGYSGQFAIGHAGFLCVGAYTAAILMARANVPFFLAMLGAGVMTALFGMLVSFPIGKLSGIYLGFVTLGFSEIVRIICLNWTSVTGGPMGIKAIPGPKIFGFSLQSSRGYYYIIFTFLVIMVFCTSRILKSRTGRAWISIRENGAAAASIGINTAQYKTMNIMYATFWEGCAGAFMATYYHFVDSSMFVTDESFNILSMAAPAGHCRQQRQRAGQRRLQKRSCAAAYRTSQTGTAGNGKGGLIYGAVKDSRALQICWRSEGGKPCRYGSAAGAGFWHYRTERCR